MKLRTLPVLAFLVSCSTLYATQEGSASSPFEDLEYRLLGPGGGGRVSRVTGVPGDRLRLYMATAAGGVWRSSNGGHDWEPIFDEQAVSSIGSVAVSPSAPEVVWVGTGEANIRGNVAEGNGIYRSPDGGDTWTHVWEAEGQIGSLAVHPRDENVVFAAALGSPFGPGPDRGVLRTRDGGRTWEKVLFVDEDSGAIDVCLLPGQPDVVFAAIWQARRTPWSLTSGGPASGLHVSRDGGDSWVRLEGEGLPEGPYGRIGVRGAPSQPGRVYALIEAEEGGLYRSEDAGRSWERVQDSHGLTQRAWYFSALTVDPQDSDEVWFPQVSMLKTLDGGAHLFPVEAGGWDYHDVWIDPDDSRRLVVASDAGVSLSWDGGEHWIWPPLPLCQLYHVATDTRDPFRVLATVQDWGTVRGPSHSLHTSGILPTEWFPVGGGEAGHIAADPEDPEIVWAGEYLGYLSRFDGRTGRAAHVGASLDYGSGRGAGELEVRFQWTAPILLSPHDPKVVYHASNVVFRTDDGGQSWTRISPDLTRDDPEKQAWSGGPITGDNTGVEYYCTIFALAESPVTPGLLWAGSDDGLVHVRRDGGESWRDVTPPDLPEWTTVSHIEASPHRAGTAYVVADRHRLDDESPYLWRTDDYGASWRSLAGDLDDELVLHVVREDPQQPGLLYLASERRVLVSHDDGEHWADLRANMPTVSVVDLVVHGDALVVGTLGRSIWVLDDLGPVRQWSEELRESELHLFEPAPATAWILAAGPIGPDRGAADNPPDGALIHYRIGGDASVEDEEVELFLEVRDDRNRLVRRLSRVPVEPPFPDDDPDSPPGQEAEIALAAEPGMQRAVWDLRWEGADLIPGARIDIGDPRIGPRALPGTYRLRLVRGDVEREATLELRRDPREDADPEAERAQLEFALRVRGHISAITALVARIDRLRDQLRLRHDLLDGREDTRDLVEAGRRVIESLDALESSLHNPEAEVTYDILAGPPGAQPYSSLGWLFTAAKDHQGPPTQGTREQEARIAAFLDERRQTFTALLDGPIAELQRSARELGVPELLVPRE